ncbi:uncharacterized protein LOC101897692 [Musca domestica]|uniref:Phospholipase A2 n=1 Tax=Musca domestica TaxID=7370 RepID=A0A9J7CW36_MUSDO|nr:uncharacterized protein LOC101897692 [Musca domestica]
MNYFLFGRKLLLLIFYITAVRRTEAMHNYAHIYQIPNGYPAKAATNKMILHDMKCAFHPITNNSVHFEHIMTEMYNMPMKNPKINSAMVFKLPLEDEFTRDNRPKERMIFMDRQEFIEPTFPNLTESYMALRRFRYSKRPLNKKITELMKIEMNAIESQTTHDPWSNLGLDGWNGDIAQPTTQDYRQSSPSNSLTEYPYHEITKDLYGGISSTEYLRDINEAEMKEKQSRDELRKEMDENVFIARSNDPFGYSTKWEKRNQTKHKRDVLRLYSMLKCSTGCDPLIYKGYGCYCGFLGHGIPADGIDSCCKLHDKCYEHSNCLSYLEYFVPYVWKCYRGKPLCAIDHGEWGGPNSCAARLCYCDLRLSRCLRQYACPSRRAVCKSSLARRLQNFIFT